MRCCVLPLIALAALCSLQVANANSDITELHSYTAYKDWLANTQTGLLFGSSSWCKGCVDVMNDIERVAKELPSEWNVRFATFKGGDEGINEWVKDDLKVEGYPHLKIIDRGNPEMFRAKRDYDGIMKTFRILAQGSPRMNPTKASLAEVKDDKQFQHAFFGFFQSEESEGFKALKTMSEDYTTRSDFIFFASVGDKADKDLMDALGVKKGQEAIVGVLSWTDQPVIKSEGPWDVDSITSFVKDNSHPPIAEFGPVWAKYMNSKPQWILKVIYDYKDDKWDDSSHKDITDVLRTLHQRFNGEYTIAVQSRDRAAGVLKQTGTEDVRVVGQLYKFGQKDMFIYEEEWNADSVSRWLDGHRKGRLYKWVKSQPVPKTQPNYVVDVVGKTFRNIVMDPNKDVMIEFYAPWCGHCKKLTPIYEQVAKKLRKVKTVVIAKMDATANEWDRDLFPVTGFPTIYFVPGGKGTVAATKYKYARDKETLLKFIKASAGIPYEIPKKGKRTTEEKKEL